jgi:hypothetical protein
MQDTPHSPRLRRLEGRIAEIAKSRRLWPWAIAALAILLSLPTLTIGWMADDYAEGWIAMHNQAMGLPDTIASMKCYVAGEPDAHRYLAEHGVLPVWSDPGMKLCFWRPLSELTEWSDYQVWPHNPVAMHAHSIGWYALLVLVACCLYRRLLSPAAALIAGLAFCVDPTHGVPVGWICDRYALISPMFAMVALAAHDAWRKQRESKWMVAAWAAFAAALLAGEIGVAALGYLVGYAAFAEQGALRRRVASIAPYVVLAGAWLVTRSALGFGTRGIPEYMDPVADPLAFVAALPQRMLDLFVAEWYLPAYWLRPPPDAGGGGLVLTLVSVALTAIVVAVLVPQLRRSGMSRALAVGMVFSLVPPAVTLPSERHLVMASIGAMALLGQVLAEFLVAPTRPRRVMSAAIGLLALLALIVGPARFALQLPLQARTARELLVDPLLRVEADAAGVQRTWIILSASRGFTKLPLIRDAHGLASGHRVWVLADPREFATLGREGDDLIVATAKRRTDDGAPEVTTLALDGMDVTRYGDAAGVRRVEYRLAGGVGHERFRWMTWRDGKLVDVPPPSPGEVIDLGRK